MEELRIKQEEERQRKLAEEAARKRRVEEERIAREEAERAAKKSKKKAAQKAKKLAAQGITPPEETSSKEMDLEALHFKHIQVCLLSVLYNNRNVYNILTYSLIEYNTNLALNRRTTKNFNFKVGIILLEVLSYKLYF